MWISQNRIHRLKIAIHLFQAVLTFVTGCLTLAILTQKDTNDSRVQWCFALCFLTMPALMYQCIVPCWTRLWRMANPYIFLSIDAIYTIFWISAFSAVTAWTAKGMRQGALDKTLSASSGSCSTFAFGSKTTCQLSQATTGFGVIICILFLLATLISILDIRNNNSTISSTSIYGHSPTTSQTKDTDDTAWPSNSTSTTLKHLSSTSTLAQSSSLTHTPSWPPDQTFIESDTREGRHPGRQVSCASAKTIPYERDDTPSAMSPTLTEERYVGIFPPADRGYSFSKD